MKISRRSLLLGASAASVTVMLPVKPVVAPASSLTPTALAVEQIKAGIRLTIQDIQLWQQVNGQSYTLSDICDGYGNHHWESVNAENDSTLEHAIMQSAKQVAELCVKQCQDLNKREISEFNLEVIACGSFALTVHQLAEEENIAAIKTLVRPLVEQAGITVTPSVIAA